MGIRERLVRTTAAAGLAIGIAGCKSSPQESPTAQAPTPTELHPTMTAIIVPITPLAEGSAFTDLSSLNQSLEASGFNSIDLSGLGSVPGFEIRTMLAKQDPFISPDITFVHVELVSTEANVRKAADIDVSVLREDSDSSSQQNFLQYIGTKMEGEMQNGKLSGSETRWGKFNGERVAIVFLMNRSSFNMPTIIWMDENGNAYSIRTSSFRQGIEIANSIGVSGISRSFVDNLPTPDFYWRNPTPTPPGK